jgi:hypothetical protein
MIKALVSASLGVVLVLSIAGCTPEPNAAPGASLSASPSAPASTEQSSTEPSDAESAIRPSISDLIVTPTGIGPLVVGAPVPSEIPEAALLVWNPTYCLDGAAAPADPEQPYAGAWQTNYAESPLAYGDGTGEPFNLITADGLQTGAIAQMMVRGSEVSTEEGVAPGATRAALEAAYPSFDSIVRGETSDVYVIRGADGGALWFEVANEAPAGSEYWDEGIVEKVLWISIMPADVEPRARSGGDSAGPCPA